MSAGIQLGTVILAIGGVPVANTTDAGVILSEKTANQTISVLCEYKEDPQMYDITLPSVHPDLVGSTIGTASSGYMGILLGQP